ncbi:tRNA (cytosine(38)-C(5))-methyltransferase [Culicoides brevitarsis]|uniref:tRNA (cytosine(38)-C(5))-methyltransferase n=1 Tax=Culicoides brevitarsis TaxID=469753 RepID=UPI00307BD2E1
MEDPKTIDKVRVLELFSGIGGMHYGLLDSGIPFEIKLAIDINDIANKVYAHNFPSSKIVSKNIKGLTPAFINKLGINTICMSPPCQPFSRNGNFKDLEDARSDPFNHICEMIPALTSVDFILMENVMGFEKSVAHKKYIGVLQDAGFSYEEFIISPSELGVPNSRNRYYCIARRHFGEAFRNQMISTEKVSEERQKIEEFLEQNKTFDDFYLSDKILSTRFKVFDIVDKDSTNSMCFTKAYTHYLEGTGSVFTEKSKAEVQKAFENLLPNDEKPEDPEQKRTKIDPLPLLKPLKLRFFTPREVANLMSFPSDKFSFPDTVTNKQRYRLLGNSVNIKVVSHMIKCLFNKVTFDNR